MLEELVVLVTRYVLSDLGGAAERSEVLDEVVAQLADADEFQDLSRDEVDKLLTSVTTELSPVVLVGDELAELTIVAEGTTFTHRLTENERAASWLELDADLPVLGRMAFADGGLHMADGARLDLRSRQRHGKGRAGTPLQTHQLAGPEGWLDRWASGTLLALSATDGILSIDAVDEPGESGTSSEPDAAELAAVVGEHLRAAYEQANGGDGAPVFAEELQAAWLVEGWTGLDESTPPFGAIVQAAGFELNGAMVGLADRWEDHARLNALIERIMRHGDHLEEDESEAVAELLSAFEAWLADASVVPEATLLDRLARYPNAAVCLEEELIRLDPRGENIDRFLAVFGATGSRHRSAALVDTLHALAADLQGDTAAAEAHIDAARLADPDWYPAIDWRVRFLEVRGQPQEAVNVLQHYRMPEDDELLAMRSRLRQAWTDVGRNEPCPCGSGRKFKQCHQGRDSLPPDARVSWLLDKVRSHVVAFRPLLLDDLPAPSRLPTSHLFALDVAMFDFGGAEGFLRARRSLLPPEEVALLESWVPGNRPSVYRVTEVGEAAIAVTDQADAQQLLVRPTSGWADVAPYDLVWARLLPGGDSWWSSGIIRPTTLAQRADLLAAAQGDPVELHRLLIGLTDGPGPRQLAGDGQPLVEAMAVWTVPGGREQIAEVLDSLGERSDADADTWTATLAQGVVAHLMLDDFDPLLGSSAGVSGADDGIVGDDETGGAETGGVDKPGDGDRWQLEADTTSIAGHQATIERIEGLFPGAERVVDHAIPVARLEAIERDDELLGRTFEGGWDDDEWDDDDAEIDVAGTGDPLADEAMTEEAMTDLLAVVEEQWADQPSAVLGDVSPRQASTDPDRVDDLRTLLREMERREGLVSIERLYDLLGLDPS